MGLAARSTEGREAYIKTPAANIYTGVFAYCRNDYKNENGTKADGVKLVNVVPLEEYISGVLPYEINNSWPIEVQKAFAITVRSYTIANMGRHSSFDLCNTQHCQVYKGVGYVNDTVSEAVNSTAGLVMKYGNKIVSAYYSSSAGGVTVSAHEAWGGDPEPYMVARETPWEDYMNYANGFWIVEVSPDELLDYLKNTKGYTELNGSIADISIQQLAQNSTYVYSLKITDTYGNSIVLKKTDTIRSTLAKYLNSANFVVGKGSVQYTESVNLDHTYENNYNNGSGVTSEDKDFGYISLNDYSVQSEYGKSDSQYINGYITIITEDGVDTYLRSDAFVITKENAASFLDDDELEGIDVDNNANSSEENWQTEVIDDNISGNIETFTKVAYASDPSNFIFVGKGWGHGVGMSQYGARELALMGYDYKYILDAYFTNITITNYR